MHAWLIDGNEQTDGSRFPGNNNAEGVVVAQSLASQAAVQSDYQILQSRPIALNLIDDTVSQPVHSALASHKRPFALWLHTQMWIIMYL